MTYDHMDISPSDRNNYPNKKKASQKNETLSIKIIRAYKAWPDATYEEIGYRLRLQPELCEKIIEAYKRREAGA